MSRTRRQPSHDFLDFFLLISPWWSVGIAVLGYVVWRFVPQAPTFDRLGEMLAPLWLGFWVLVAVVAVAHQKRRSDLLEAQTGLASLRTMGWKDFERLVAEAYRRQGFQATYQFDDGPDGGVDVRLRKDGKLTLVQCKQRTQWSVGVRVVREMFGLMHAEKADHVVITTTSSFTAEAEAFAAGKPITLLNGDQLWEMVRAVQQAAVTEAAALPTAETATAAPDCPDCGGGMRRKTQRATGQPFWGCCRWPACHGNRSV